MAHESGEPSPTWPEFYRDPAKAASYEARRSRSWSRRLSWALERRVVARLLRRAGARGPWLDLACGPGRFLELLPPGSTGVDYSPAMLELAAPRARAAGARLVVADARRLPFPDGAFEGVLCLRFLHHLEPAARAAVLAEVARVSIRHAIVGYPTDRSLRALLKRLRRRGKGVRQSPRELALEVRARGFEPRESAGVFPPFSETTLAWLVKA